MDRYCDFMQIIIVPIIKKETQSCSVRPKIVHAHHSPTRILEKSTLDHS